MKTNDLMFILVFVLLASSLINISAKLNLTGLANAVGTVNLIISPPSSIIPGPSPGGGAGGAGGGCSPEWECGEWGLCTEDRIRIRECIDIKCNYNSQIENATCEFIRYIGDVDIETQIPYETFQFERVIFTVNDLNHTATILNIGPDYADLEILSERILVRVNLHETIYVDIDRDGIYDVSIRLDDLIGKSAYITIKQIMIPPIIITSPAMPVISKSNIYTTMFLSVVILVIYLLFLITRKKKKKSKK